MAPWFHDVRVGFRSLRRRPWFTTIVVLGLALGIGANVAAFTFVDSLLLRPAGLLDDPDRLVSLTPRPISIPGAPGTFRRPISPGDFERVQDNVRSFSRLATFVTIPLHVAASNQAVRVSGQAVSDEYFETLGLPLTGPGIEFQGGDPASVVLGHGLARRLFAEVREAIGTKVLLNQRPFVVVGVTPEDFAGTWLNEAVDLWLPLSAYPILHSGAEAGSGAPEPSLFWMIGRLHDGVTLDQAQLEIDSLSGATPKTEPSGADAGRLPALDLTGDVMVQPSVRSEVVDPLFLMILMSLLVLFLTCANLAALLWARALERQRELGMRLALGSSKWRLVREFLVESLLLAGLGGVFGIVGAVVLLRVLETAQLSRLLPDLPELSVDFGVLGFAAVLSLLTGLLVGLIPALRASGVDPRTLLESRAGGSRRRTLGRDALVVTQVAVALVLLMGTGLLVQTLRHLSEIDVGFDPENVVNLRLDLERQGYSEAAGTDFWRRLRSRAEALPGIESATVALSTPLTPDQGGGRIAAVERSPGQPPRYWSYNVVGTNYFRTLRIPLLQGRGFGEEDETRPEPVAVVNTTMASLLWPDGAGVGNRVKIAGTEHVVVGVAQDVPLRNLREPVEPHFYLPFAGNYEPAMNLQVRTQQSMGQTITTLRREIQTMDRTLPVYDAEAVVQQIGATLARQRLLSRAFGAFSFLALVLTTLGIYAVTAQYVRQETRALAIRLALGCRPRNLVGLVTRRAVLITGIGLAVGIVLVYLASRSFSIFLYDIQPTDPATLAGVTGVILLISGLAAGWPAWRATRIDPSGPLRES